MRRVDLYFDYISPYAYLGWVELRALCAEASAELSAHPVLFAGLLNHWGQLGPAEIAPKRRWIFADVFRIAKLRGIPLVGPAAHPFNPLMALRLSLPEVCGERQFDVIDAVMRAGWGEGIDLGSPEAIGAALDRAGLPGAELLEKAQGAEAKQALKARTEEAIARGVFGVPAMVVNGELFWGSDRMDHVALALAGQDPLDRAAVEKALERPRGADRPRSPLRRA